MHSWLKACRKCTGKSDAQALLEQSDPKSSASPTAERSFSATFDLPFQRDDVFSELVNTNQPLGLSSQNVKLFIQRQGKSPNAPVSVGCVRKAEFVGPFEGYTVSELVQVETGKLLRWEQLQSDTVFNLVGHEVDGTLIHPECLIELETMSMGTRVRLFYTFSHVQVKHPLLCLLTPCIPGLLSWYLQRNVASTWVNEMGQKGHKVVTLDQVGFKAKATRSEEQRRRDKEEEERIKQKATEYK